MAAEPGAGGRLEMFTDSKQESTVSVSLSCELSLNAVSYLP